MLEKVLALTNSTYAQIAIAAPSGREQIHVLALTAVEVTAKASEPINEQVEPSSVRMASNNLNRLRLRDYDAIFQRTFSSVDLTILTSKKEELRRLRHRIRSEFLTGNDDVDAAAIIRIEAQK